MKKIIIFIVFSLIVFSAMQQSIAQTTVQWKDLVGLVDDKTPGHLSKIEREGWGNAGAISSNYLSTKTNGSFEFNVSLRDMNYSVGLSTQNHDHHFTSVEFGFYFERGSFFILSNQRMIGQFGNFRQGDTFKIRREHGKVLFFQNNIPLFSDGMDFEAVYYVDLSVFIGDVNTIDLYVDADWDIPTPILHCNNSDNYNWVATKAFDVDGTTVKSESKIFTDFYGKPLQTQIKNLTESDVLVSQPVYDKHGRSSLQTLSAPINQSYFCLKEDFIQNTNGQPYKYSDFDKTITSSNILGEVNNPKAVKNTEVNSLGWYYSENNTRESHVSAEGNPYTRVEYSRSNPGRIRKSAKAGDVLSMGEGHENETYHIPAKGELYYAYGYHGSWNQPNITQGSLYDFLSGADNTTGTLSTETDYQVRKEIKIDANEQEYVSFYDFDDKLVATCRSGLSDPIQYVSTQIPFGHYADIHVPEGCEDYVLINDHTNSTAKFKILDLRTDLFITNTDGTAFFNEGESPTLNAGFYRIIHLPAYSFSPGETYPAEGIVVSYRLNYERWNLNYYDKGKRLVQTIPPLGFDTDYIAGPVLSSLNVTEGMSGQDVSGNSMSGDNNITTPFSSGTASTGVAQLSLNVLTPASIACVNTGGSGYALRMSSPENVINDIVTQRIAQFPNEPNYNRSTGLVSNEKNALLQINKFTEVRSLSNIKFNEYIKQNLGNITKVNVGSTCPYKEYKITYDFYRKTSTTNINTPDEILSTGNIMTIRHYTFDSDCDCVKKWVVTYNVNSNVLGTGLIDQTTYFGMQITNITGQEQLETGGALQTLTSFNELHQIDLKLSVDYTTVDQSPDHKMANTYAYNSDGNLLGSNLIDEGITEFLYRNDGKIKFSQNALQRDDSKYAFTNYDEVGRIKQMGIYTYTSSYQWQNHYNQPVLSSGTSVLNLLELEDGLPASGKTEVVDYIYDTKDPNFHSETGLSSSQWKQKYTRGKVSYIENDEVKYWFSYDYKGRTEWFVQKFKNKSTDNVKTIVYTYDGSSNITEAVYNQTKTDEFRHRYTHDADNRLSKVEVSIDGGVIYKEKARYSYYLHGGLKREVLGENVQGIDYVYTINGWLKSINNPKAMHSGFGNFDPGLDNGTSIGKDQFAMTLDYFNGDYKRVATGIENARHGSSSNPVITPNDRFDGSISTQHWNHSTEVVSIGSNQQETMLYQYNDNNFLKLAQYAMFKPQYVSGGATVIATVTSDERYKVWDLNYDLNGNITRLKRNGGNTSSLLMDNLTYSYAEVGGIREDNKLMRAQDVAGDYSGMDDATAQSHLENYEYNGIGQLRVDKSKGHYYAYYSDGLVKGVYANAAHTIPLTKYFYDVFGKEIKTEHYNGSTVESVIWTFRDPNGKTISTYDGTHQLTNRPVYGLKRLGYLETVTDPHVTYELKDHVENVRALVDETSKHMVAASNYYPFGMVISKLNAPDIKSGYQGEFTVKDQKIKKDKFQLRLWDSAIGRWISPDPKRQYSSPYLGMGNNPLSLIDPDGGATSTGISNTSYAPEPSDVQSFQMSNSLSSAGSRFHLGAGLVFESSPNSSFDANWSTIQTGVIPAPAAAMGIYSVAMAQTALRLAAVWVGALLEPSPVGEAIALAMTIYAVNEYGFDLMRAMIQSVERTKARTEDKTPTEVYELIVNKTGAYVDVRGNIIQLTAGDVWKFGETSTIRYSQPELNNMAPGGVTKFTLFHGTKTECRIMEKILIYSYAIFYGEKPPGNRIYR